MLRKLLHAFGIKDKPDQIKKLLASGNLVVGKNSTVKDLSIYIFGRKENQVNIVIGDNCSISGNILIHAADANIKIGNDVFIAAGTRLFCYEKIEIGSHCMVSWGCTLIDTNAHSLHSSERRNDVADWIKGPEHKNWKVVKHAPVILKDHCWIGFNSIVTKGVTLSEGTVIGCGSVVTKDTKPYSIYGGNPAVFIKETD